MRLMRLGAAITMVVLGQPTFGQSTRQSRQQSGVRKEVEVLVARASALSNIGRTDDALVLAAQAVARAEAATPPDPLARFIALRRQVMLAIAKDPATGPDGLEALSRAAEDAYGRDGFQALFARFKQRQWNYARKRPGTTLDDLAQSASAVEAPSRTDEERTLAAVALAVVANEISQGDVAAAAPWAARARALADTLQNTAAERGQVYQFLATIALKADRPAEAMALADRSIAMYEADQGPTATGLLPPLSTKAAAARRMGDVGAVDALLRRAVGIVDSSPQTAPQFKARAYLDYGRFLAGRGQHDLAFPMIERAAAEAAALPEGASLPQSVILTAGQIYLEAGLRDRALVHLRRVLAMTAQGGASLLGATALVEIGRAELGSGDLAAAATTAAAAMAAMEAATPPGNSARGTARLLLADIAVARGDGTGAAALYRTATTELAAGDVAALAAARIRLGATLADDGALDEAAWRGARASADAIERTLGRAAPPDPALLNAAIDVGWARSRQVARR